MSTAKPKANYTKANGEGSDLQNHLKREFNPKAPSQGWTSNITYVKISGRFFYVCVVMDLFSRKILAYKVSSNINTKLTLDAFNLAYRKRGCPKGVMFHSDHGSQYTAKEFRKALDKADFVQSFSAKGHPFDNAVVESFFKYLKYEELNRRNFNSPGELNLSLFEYIEGFYNISRPRSANVWLSPNEREKMFYDS